LSPHIISSRFISMSPAVGHLWLLAPPSIAYGPTPSVQLKTLALPLRLCEAAFRAQRSDCEKVPRIERVIRPLFGLVQG
jgi:hypothetical protein